MAFLPPPHLSKRDLLRNPSLVLGFVAGLVPGIAAAGFIPFWSLSPLAATGIAASGGAVAGALATKKRIKGAITGVVMCAGIALGIVGYVASRTALIPTTTFLEIEFVIGAGMGLVPGLFLRSRWFDDGDTPQEPSTSR